MPDVDTAAVKPLTSDRLVSLDLLRGLTVMGMILVNSMAGMAGEGAVYPTLLHSQWDGVTLADLVFPAFLFMVGVSIPLSLREKPGVVVSPSEQHSRIIWRSIRLVLLGFILSNLWWFSDFEATTWRGFGVLQRIGLAYCACALLFLWCSSRTRMIIAGAILILYWPINLIPALDGLPNDLWQRGHNFVASVDRVLLGDHNYVKGAAGYDPEGLLGTLPAIAQGLIGVAIGEYMLRAGGKGVTGRLILAGIVMLVAGYRLGLRIPGREGHLVEQLRARHVRDHCLVAGRFPLAFRRPSDDRRPRVYWESSSCPSASMPSPPTCCTWSRVRCSDGTCCLRHIDRSARPLDRSWRRSSQSAFTWPSSGWRFIISGAASGSSESSEGRARTPGSGAFLRTLRHDRRAVSPARPLAAFRGEPAPLDMPERFPPAPLTKGSEVSLPAAE